MGDVNLEGSVSGDGSFMEDDEVFFDCIKHADWIIPVAVNIALTLITLWMLVSLLYYGLKKKTWRPNRASCTDKLNAGLVYATVIVCAFMCLFRYSMSLAFMNVGFNPDDDRLCEAFADTARFAYSCVLYSTAFFMWYRQRAFYTHRMLNVSYNKVVRFFSFASIFVIVVYGVAATVLILSADQYHPSRKGCKLDLTEQNTLYWIPVVIGVVFYNLTLLGLLSYALTHIKLFQQKLSTKLSQHPGTTTIASLINTVTKSVSTENDLSEKDPTSEQSNNNAMETAKHPCTFANDNSKAKRIKSIIKKTLIFAIMAISFDFFTNAFAFSIADPNKHRRIVIMLFDINSFFNLLFIVFSFARYKEMLTAPFRKFTVSET